MAYAAQIALARQHPDARTAARFRFLQERVKQRYGQTLDPQAAAMVVAVDRYHQKTKSQRDFFRKGR